MVSFQAHATEFNTNCALQELYNYAMKYNEQLSVTLEEDEFSQKQRLAYKLEQVHNIMESNPWYVRAEFYPNTLCSLLNGCLVMELHDMEIFPWSASVEWIQCVCCHGHSAQTSVYHSENFNNFWAVFTRTNGKNKYSIEKVVCSGGCRKFGIFSIYLLVFSHICQK